MRELKFRAWDKQNNKMTTVWSIGWKAWDSPDEVINYVEIQRDGTEKVFDHEVILMQFTGLLDKNGVEIYEGDVCKRVFDYNDEENVFIFAVIWQPPTFRGKLIQETGFNYFEWPTDYFEGHRVTVEVLGNIHETPKLLEKQ